MTPQPEAESAGEAVAPSTFLPITSLTMAMPIVLSVSPWTCIGGWGL